MNDLFNLNRKIVLSAPMAGYTNDIYRRFARRFGADLVFTEMISADGLVYSTERTLELMKFSDEEKPIGIQFFTADPDIMYKAALMIRDSGFSVLDLNFGCPVRKVTKRGAGSSLLKSSELAIEIVSAAMESNLPVSVKVRCGFNSCDEWVKTLELLEKLVNLGVSFITIHPRSARQMFSGKSDWSLIADAVNKLHIPIIGSGDLFSIDAVVKMVETANVAGVSIARGGIANFEIFTQVRAFFENKAIPKFDFYNRIETMREFIAEEFESYGEDIASKWCRKFLMKLTKNIPDASSFRRRLSYIRTLDDVNSFLDDILSRV